MATISIAIASETLNLNATIKLQTHRKKKTIQNKVSRLHTYVRFGINIYYENKY